MSRHPYAPEVTVTAASLGGVPTAEIAVDGIGPRHVVLYFDASLACGHGESPPRPSEPPNEAAGVLAAVCGRPIAATNSAMDRVQANLLLREVEQGIDVTTRPRRRCASAHVSSIVNQASGVGTMTDDDTRVPD